MPNLSMKKLFSRFKSSRNKSRGQSLVELALVLAVLLFMLVGVTEYGFLLNRYLNLVDATREAARYGADINPFKANGSVDSNFFVRPDTSQPESITNPPGLADIVEDYLRPVTLDPTVGDDIVISFFGITGSNVVRFPNANGWSRYGNHTSKFSMATIEDRIDSSAPSTGVLLIEIFYNYPQTLNLPIFSNIIPNPIPVYTYAIMPLSGAEPTATPLAP